MVKMNLQQPAIVAMEQPAARMPVLNLSYGAPDYQQFLEHTNRPNFSAYLSSKFNFVDEELSDDGCVWPGE